MQSNWRSRNHFHFLQSRPPSSRIIKSELTRDRLRMKRTLHTPLTPAPSHTSSPASPRPSLPPPSCSREEVDALQTCESHRIALLRSHGGLTAHDAMLHICPHVGLISGGWRGSSLPSASAAAALGKHHETCAAQAEGLTCLLSVSKLSLNQRKQRV